MSLKKKIAILVLDIALAFGGCFLMYRLLTAASKVTS